MNNKGQALLTVIVAMTVALAVGVGVSLRSLSSSQRSSSTDTSSRVLAVAEGGAENFLVKPFSELASLSSVCDGISEDPLCVVNFDSTSTDNIASKAVIGVHTYGDGLSGFTLSVPRDQISEVNLDGYTASSIEICWADETVLSYIAYNATDIETGAVECNSCTYPTLETNSISNADGSGCYDVPVPSSPVGLRLRSLGGSSDVVINPSAALPLQGYEITSNGSLNIPGSTEEVVKTVRVRVSLPFLPGMFDYALYVDKGVIN